MIFWFYISIFLVSCFLLIRSGTWVVQSLTRIAHFLKWKEFIVAFVLMAFATSIPEFFIGIISAWNKIPQLAFGAIVGSNIIKLTLAVSLSALILGGLKIERATVRRNSIFVGIIALLPVFLILDGNLSRIDGIVLLLAFSFYIVWLFDRKEYFSKIYKPAGEKNENNFGYFFKSIGQFLGSVIILLLGAQGIIKSSSFFAEFIGVPLSFIGILLVGAGAALPEVYFSIRAGKTGHQNMILGNLMGGVVVTATLVLGITALISPIEIPDFSPYSLARLFLLISVLFFLFLSRTESKISKKEGIILILIYLAFIFFEITNQF